MMDYEIFKDVAKEKFLSYMPEKYQDMEIRVKSREKINCRMDGLSLWKADGEKTIFPTIYINDMYEKYLKSGNLQEVLQDAARAMDKAFMQSPQNLQIDVHAAKDSIIFQLINTKQNEDMLRDVPHREFQDLSIIYRWVVNTDDEEIYSTVIRNSLAKELGMGEEQLFNLAAENTRRILPPTVKSMNEVMRDMFAADGMPKELADLLIGEKPPEQTMWIISNERGDCGAASMLYEDKLHKLAESVGNDLYILPSSIHEVIAVSVEMGGPEELAQMVADVNMEEVDIRDRLSNQVYHYDKDLRKLTLATDTPNKRLDGVVTEQKAVYEAKQAR